MVISVGGTLLLMLVIAGLLVLIPRTIGRPLGPTLDQIARLFISAVVVALAVAVILHVFRVITIRL